MTGLDMQIQSTDVVGPSSRPPLTVAPLAVPPAATRTVAVRDAAVPAAPAGTASLGASLGLNRTVTDAQRALGFLDESAARLQELKSVISARLSGKPGDRAALDAKLERFDALWRSRAAATGGSLDARLQLVGQGNAQARFRIAGLENLARLAEGGNETLTFYPGGLGKPSVSVMLEAGQTQAQTLGRLNQALLPAGVAVQTDEQGRLTFASAERNLPVLQGQLMIKGGGIRFPSGQPNRVGVEVVDDSIVPSGWRAGDMPALRQTLQQVVDAQGKVMQARAAAQRALGEAASGIETARQAGDPEWAAGFSGRFGRQAAGDYSSFAQLVPALQGISRYRILSLMSLR
ncbi:hypothetical protein [Jeongeupia chitinilytica]|uniref:Flagellar hook-associated protein 2 C-terminal domain-containing protein n=1 Tax=Jeongeupia chitinilytica TaxID=1041641 RepID=A0ABQ3GZX8_9NEIS|nr:hypothetical protein [Jeongeupia chitinilytica]GHD63446.1 hypothetical protein GCM10007350_20800 [Jeongeupia chitinilytica]